MDGKLFYSVAFRFRCSTLCIFSLSLLLLLFSFSFLLFCLCFCSFQNQIDSNQIRTKRLNEIKKKQHNHAFGTRRLVHEATSSSLFQSTTKCNVYVMNVMCVCVLKLFCKILRNWFAFSTCKQFTCHLIEYKKTSNTREQVVSNS